MWTPYTTYETDNSCVPNGELKMNRSASAKIVVVLLASLVLVSCNFSSEQTDPTPEMQVVTATFAPTQVMPTVTPTLRLVPTSTLRPPPTFEPPTQTPSFTPIPSPTPTATLDMMFSVPNLRGAETPTPTSTPGCEPRKDWKLTYTVQRDDALALIADRYNTTVQALVEANCLDNPNLIVIGQELRVPGEVHPNVPAVECVPWEVLTPMDGTMAVPGSGDLTFDWRGPRAPRNLIRIYRPNGTTYEVMVELRQNETIDLAMLPDAGVYTWYVFPLDQYFRQIECLEGGPWIFIKEQAPVDATGDY
jgi:LysM repeat protein